MSPAKRRAFRRAFKRMRVRLLRQNSLAREAVWRALERSRAEHREPPTFTLRWRDADGRRP
jgi:hypothetical protein